MDFMAYIYIYIYTYIYIHIRHEWVCWKQCMLLKTVHEYLHSMRHLGFSCPPSPRWDVVLVLFCQAVASCLSPAEGGASAGVFVVFLVSLLGSMHHILTNSGCAAKYIYIYYIVYTYLGWMGFINQLTTRGHHLVLIYWQTRLSVADLRYPSDYFRMNIANVDFCVMEIGDSFQAKFLGQHPGPKCLAREKPSLLTSFPCLEAIRLWILSHLLVCWGLLHHSLGPRL